MHICPYSYPLLSGLWSRNTWCSSSELWYSGALLLLFSHSFYENLWYICKLFFQIMYCPVLKLLLPSSLLLGRERWGQECSFYSNNWQDSSTVFFWFAVPFLKRILQGVLFFSSILKKIHWLFVSFVGSPRLQDLCERIGPHSPRDTSWIEILWLLSCFSLMQVFLLKRLTSIVQIG